MNIAHVLSSFGVGGQERVALDLAVAQHAEGNHVLAVSLAPPPEGPLAQEFRARGIEVRSLPKRPGVDASLVLELSSLFFREHVDVVHTHNPQPLFYGALAGRLAGAVVVHTKHGANPDRGRRLWARRATGRLAHAYVAVSPTTANVARANAECAASRLAVIDNGIDLSRFHPDEAARREVRAELGIPEEARVVGTVGRVAPEKAHVLLVEAMGPLLDDRTRLVVVGDGSEMPAVREAARRLPGGAYVHLPGVRRDVPRLLAAMDVFVLSSKTEGLPLVIPEAMATSLPIVSTAVGGIPDVLGDGDTGFLVPSGDAIALRAAIRRVLDDRDLAAAVGARARAVALDRYSVTRMARSYLALYQRELALKSPSYALGGASAP